MRCPWEHHRRTHRLEGQGANRQGPSTARSQPRETIKRSRRAPSRSAPGNPPAQLRLVVASRHTGDRHDTSTLGPTAGRLRKNGGRAGTGARAVDGAVSWTGAGWDGAGRGKGSGEEQGRRGPTEDGGVNFTARQGGGHDCRVQRGGVDECFDACGSRRGAGGTGGQARRRGPVCVIDADPACRSGRGTPPPPVRGARAVPLERSLNAPRPTGRTG